MIKDEIPEGDSILIFSEHTMALHLLRRYIETLELGNTDIVEFDGTTNLAARNEIERRLNKGYRRMIVLMSQAVGCEGLDMQGANHVIELDAHWNPQRERQSFGRVYRTGQVKECFHYHLQGTDEKRCPDKLILTTQNERIILAEAILQEGGANKQTVAEEKVEETNQKRIIDYLQQQFGFG
jgi:SNF2 family DNA or RNA helicase